jgi:16S rRNA (guanine527-N7)-methyltransferase
MEIIKKYFDEFTPVQEQQFEKLISIYSEWNEQINVISRKDMENFYERHVLHSLAIACVIEFKPGSYILDIGTGGGFPGIPLAILFPDVKFHLVDSIGKKITVVNEVIQALGLTNVYAEQKRAEKVRGKYDFIVSRAVTAMPKFLNWTRNKFKAQDQHAYPNGIFYLKGGDLTAEFADIKIDHEFIDIQEFFEEEFFETKKVVYLPGH